jgi:hypothetical protein
VASGAAITSRIVIVIVKKQRSNFWQVLKEETWKNNNNILDMKNVTADNMRELRLGHWIPWRTFVIFL